MLCPYKSSVSSTHHAITERHSAAGEEFAYLFDGVRPDDGDGGCAGYRLQVRFQFGVGEEIGQGLRLLDLKEDGLDQGAAAPILGPATDEGGDFRKQWTGVESFEGGDHLVRRQLGAG